MSMQDVTPIDAIFDENLGPNQSVDYQELLLTVDVIMGVDWMSERPFVLYGREALEKCAASGDETYQLSCLKIGLDLDTIDLEKIVALIRHVRGSDDYRPYKSPDN